MVKLGLLPLALILGTATPAPVCADSWLMPTTATYTSCRGHARVTVTPRDLNSQLAYFSDKVAGAEPAGQRRGGRGFATARLDVRSDGRWGVIWSGRIANDIAPVEALVRDDGAYFVTFDDWHGTGYGPHVLVIYDAAGRIVRALELSDLLPATYIDALPHSVSSIQWRDVPRFSADGRQVIVPVVVPSVSRVDRHATVALGVELRTGVVTPVNRAAWRTALATALKVRADQLANDAVEKAAFFAPLFGPRVNDETMWHGYLREAIARKVGDGDEQIPSTTVLRRPEARDYSASEAWIREALSDDLAGNIAIGTLSEPTLLAVLARIAPQVPAHSLMHSTVWLALSDASWPAAAASLRHTGATLVQLDPSKPITQRPERIARRYGAGS